jgi:hypothetical protein
MIMILILDFLHVIPYFYKKSREVKAPFIITRMYTRMGRGLYSCLIY